MAIGRKDSKEKKNMLLIILLAITNLVELITLIVIFTVSHSQRKVNVTLSNTDFQQSIRMDAMRSQIEVMSERITDLHKHQMEDSSSPPRQ